MRISNLKLILVSTLPVVVPLLLSIVVAAIGAWTALELSSRGYICTRPSPTLMVVCESRSLPWSERIQIPRLVFTIPIILSVFHILYTLALFRLYRVVEVMQDRVTVYTLIRSHSLDRSRIIVRIIEPGFRFPLLLGPARVVRLESGDHIAEVVLHARDVRLLLNALSSNNRYERAPVN